MRVLNCVTSLHVRCFSVPSFCHGKPEGPYHLPNYTHGGIAPPNAQVRRDDFPGSRVRKCIHIMHYISISSWHHNGHIIPAFVTYHIHALHFA